MVGLRSFLDSLGYILAEIGTAAEMAMKKGRMARKADLFMMNDCE